MWKFDRNDFIEYFSHRANVEKENLLFFSVSSVRNFFIANHFNQNDLAV